MSPISSYSPFILAPFRPLKPDYLIFFVTNRCNARCSMCFNHPADISADNELTVSEIEQIAQSFRGLIQLTISGGEPFLRDDLPEIIRAFTRESGVKFITLPTNAFMPERVIKATEKIVSDNPSVHFNFCVSVDEIGELHDQIRGVEGGFQRLLTTYREAMKLAERFDNLEVHTTTVLSALNAGKIGTVLDWINENMQSDIPEVLLVRGSPRDPIAETVDLQIYEQAVKVIEDMGYSLAARRGFKAKLITSLTSYMSEVLIKSERENRMIVPCLAAKKLVILRPDGTIDPCEVIESLIPHDQRPEGLESFSMGNIRDAEYNISNIMHSPKALAVREFIKSTQCHCTFECAIFANVIFRPSLWPGLGIRFLKDWT